MATNIVVPGNKSRALNRWLKRAGRMATAKGLGGKGHMRRRMWYASAAPSCVSAQYSTQPYAQLQLGDLAIDVTNDNAYICTVVVASDTDATFSKINV